MTPNPLTKLPWSGPRLFTLCWWVAANNRLQLSVNLSSLIVVCVLSSVEHQLDSRAPPRQSSQALSCPSQEWRGCRGQSSPPSSPAPAPLTASPWRRPAPQSHTSPPPPSSPASNPRQARIPSLTPDQTTIQRLRKNTEKLPRPRSVLRKTYKKSRKTTIIINQRTSHPARRSLRPRTRA